MIIKHYRQFNDDLKGPDNPKGMEPKGGLTLIALYYKDRYFKNGHACTIHYARCHMKDTFKVSRGIFQAGINSMFVAHCKPDEINKKLDQAADLIMEASTLKCFERHPRRPVPVNKIFEEVFNA